MVLRTYRARIIKERDGRLAARMDEHPESVGYGATEDEARHDLARAIRAAKRSSSSYVGSG